MSYYHTFETSIGEWEIEIKINFQFSLEDIGIGDYECNGFKGFDSEIIAGEEEILAFFIRLNNDYIASKFDNLRQEHQEQIYELLSCHVQDNWKELIENEKEYYMDI